MNCAWLCMNLNQHPRGVQSAGKTDSSPRGIVSGTTTFEKEGTNLPNGLKFVPNQMNKGIACSLCSTESMYQQKKSQMGFVCMAISNQASKLSMQSSNPTLKFAPFGRWDAPSARPLATRVCRAWHLTSEVQVLVPGIRRAEG